MMKNTEDLLLIFFEEALSDVFFFFRRIRVLRSFAFTKKETSSCPPNKQANSPNILITFQPQFGKGVFLQQSLAILILDTAISVPGTFLKPRSTARYSLLEIAPRILHPYQLKILKGGNDLIIHSSFHQNCERLIEKWPHAIE